VLRSHWQPYDEDQIAWAMAALSEDDADQVLADLVDGASKGPGRA